MGDVVSFKPEEPKTAKLVLICTHCGCRSFYHYADGGLECANCDAVVTIPDDDGTKWLRIASSVPEDIEAVPEEDSRNLSVKIIGNATLARKSVLAKAKKWGEDVIAIFVFNKDGEGSHWSGAETAEQRDWVLRKMKGVREHMKKTEFPK